MGSHAHLDRLRIGAVLPDHADDGPGAALQGGDGVRAEQVDGEGEDTGTTLAKISVTYMAPPRPARAIFRDDRKNPTARLYSASTSAGVIASGP
jgi:hypothetical protein